MDDASESASWFESRRLIVAQLSRMDEAIREITTTIQRSTDATRDSVAALAKETQALMAGLNVRLALLEMRAKLWGGLIGLVGGAAATLVVQLVVQHWPLPRP